MNTEVEYDVRVNLDAMVEVRDGTRLATDIFRPCDPETGKLIEKPMPVLLDRTPYDKRGNLQRHGEWYAKRGYVVAIQDVRGRFRSEGDFYIFANEAEDGADTVEWLVEQPYCDGQIGTIGTSYGAWTQSALATQDPDGLAAMFVNQGAANAWTSAFRHNGAFELRWLTWALVHGGGFSKAALNDRTLRETLANLDTRDILANEPVRRGHTPLRHLSDYEEWVFDAMESEGTADLWENPGLNFEMYYDQSADVPTVYAGAWYDSYGKATCENFVAFNERSESDQFLLMGPWTHGWDAYPLASWSKSYSGELEFGSDATRDYKQTRLDFFDHYLKGMDTWDDHPIVEYWRMGTGNGHQTDNNRLYHGGKWVTADEWPLPDTESVRYYAHGNGTLSRDRPDVDGGATTYRFDPTDPVPTIGGNCSSYAAFEQREEPLIEYPLAKRRRYNITGSGGFDQRTRSDTFGASAPHRPLGRRDDVLTFRTPPLENTTEITGPIRVCIYGETDAADTDFTAKLLDEYPPSAAYPEGFALNLSDSICRARYRGYRTKPDPVAPGEIYTFEMEPYPTANVFAPGHSIRLDISSSNFPRYDVNRNTGGSRNGDRDYVIARNTVHHSREYSSYIELPVRSNEDDLKLE